MKANASLNSVAERFDTFTSVIFHCNNQNTARNNQIILTLSVLSGLKVTRTATT